MIVLSTLKVGKYVFGKERKYLETIVLTVLKSYNCFTLKECERNYFIQRITYLLAISIY